MVADHLSRLLQGLLPTHIQTNGRIKLQCTSAGSSLRTAEHHADLFTQLVNKDHGTIGLTDHAGQLPQRLGHQSGLQAHMRIPHLAVDLSLGHQCRHRVYNHDIHCAGTNHGLRYLQRLFSVIRLGNVEIVNIYPDPLRIYRIQSMLGVNKACNTSPLLYLRYNMKRNGRLTAGLRTIYLNYPPLGDPAQSQSDIQAERACWDRLNIHIRTGIPQLHDRTFPVRLLYLRNGST